MGFYLRKSISVGPLRFNLSSGGVGMSVGVRGFRVGTGPRGNYVHMGMGGLYYRATLPPGGRRTAPKSMRSPSPGRSDSPIPLGTHAPLEAIESADVGQIVDSSSKDLLDEMNTRQKRWRLFPATVAVAVLAWLWAASTGWPGWALALAGLAAIGLAVFVYLRDALRKTVVLFYDFDVGMDKAYGAFHEAVQPLLASSRAWHIAARGAVHDRKYHAGASSLVDRKPTAVTRSPPPFVKTNIETIAIPVGRQTLHFFPDRVLIYDADGVGAVHFNQLQIRVEVTQFIEEPPAPSDATVVGRTWRFVNKSGGPDRRFNNNAELPVCKYDQMTIASATGLNEVVQASRAGVLVTFALALEALANAVPPEIGRREVPAR